MPAVVRTYYLQRKRFASNLLQAGFAVDVPFVCMRSTNNSGSACSGRMQIRMQDAEALTGQQISEFLKGQSRYHP